MESVGRQAHPTPCGAAGYRSPYLPHAKRALYQVSYNPVLVQCGTATARHTTHTPHAPPHRNQTPRWTAHTAHMGRKRRAPIGGAWRVALGCDGGLCESPHPFMNKTGRRRPQMLTRAPQPHQPWVHSEQLVCCVLVLGQLALSRPWGARRSMPCNRPLSH